MSNITFNKRPIVYYCLALIVGIYIALILDDLKYILAGIILISAFIILFRKKRIFILILICLNLGMLSFGMGVINVINSHTTEGEGVITGRVMKINNSDFIIDGVKYGGVKQKVNALCENYGDLDNIKVGDKVKIIGYISPKPFEITNGKDVSYFLDRTLYSVVIYDLEKTGYKESPKDFIKNKVEQLYKKAFENDNFGFAFSFLSGDKQYLDKETQGTLNYIGLSHILAISGMHIGFILGLFYILSVKLKINKKLSYWIISIVLLLYLYLTGFSPSTIRAALFFFIMITAEILFQRNDNLSSLCLSIFLICLVSPLMLFNISFLMSALSVLGIFMFYRKIFEKIKTKNRFVNKVIISSISLSVSANSFLLLIMLGEFNQLNFMFVLANLVTLPTVALCFTLQFVFTIIALVLPFMGFLLNACDVLISVILYASNLLAGNNLLVIEMSGLSILFCAIYFVELIVLSPYFIGELKTKKKIVSIAFISLFLLLIIGLF